MTIAERNNKLKHFITCLKCEASGKCCDDNCLTQYYTGNMGKIIENLEAISKALEQEPRWIPCSEKLPEENMDVLVVVEFPDGKDGTLQRIEIASFGLMYHLSSEKGWITNNFTRIARAEVKAWMPLPESYKAESEEVTEQMTKAEIKTESEK